MGCECALIGRLQADIQITSELITQAAQIYADGEEDLNSKLTNLANNCDCMSPDNLADLKECVLKMDDELVTELGRVCTNCENYKAYLDTELENAKQRDTAHHQAEAAAAAAAAAAT